MTNVCPVPRTQSITSRVLHLLLLRLRTLSCHSGWKTPFADPPYSVRLLPHKAGLRFLLLGSREILHDYKVFYSLV